MFVSIIVPVYNTEKYLDRCISSVISQSFADWELLLVDDGSNDLSGSICDKHSNADRRIKVFHIPNGGVSNARNVGLNNASGDYILFLDSDDYIGTDCLEKCCLLCDNNKLDVLQYSIVKIHDGNITKRYSCDIPILNGYDYINTKQGLLCVGGNVIRSALACEARFPNGVKYGEDRFFLLSILAKASRVMRTSSIEYYYEDNPNSASQNLKSSAITKSIDLTLKLVKEFPNLDDYFNTVLVGYIMAIISNNDIDYNSYKKIIERIPMCISKSLRLYENFFIFLNYFSYRLSYCLFRYLYIIKKKL